MQTDAILDAGDQTFSLAYAASDADPNATTDVFVTQRAFEPAYSIDADAPESTAPMEPVSVEFEVHNRGEAAGTDPVPVELRNDSETIETTEVGPLAPNESVTESFDTLAPNAGELTVALANEGTDGVPEPWFATNVTVRTGMANLSVSDVDAARVDEDTARVEVELTNDGSADASDVPVSLDDGTGELERVNVDRVPSEGATTVETTIDVANLNRSVQDRIAIDPDGTLPDGSIERETLSTWFLQPSIGLHGPMTYREGPESVTATLQVSNEGAATAETTIRVEDTESGELIGETVVEAPPAVGTNATFRSVSVPLDEDADSLAGRSVRFTADTTVPNLDPGGAATEDVLGPITPATGTVRTTVIDAATNSPVENATVLYDGQGGVTDDRGVVTVTVPAGTSTATIDADGYDLTTTDVTVPTDETIDEQLLVGTPDSPLADYANDDGRVDVDGLLAAIDDFRSDEIPVDVLLDVIDAFRSSEPVV